MHCWILSWLCCFILFVRITGWCSKGNRWWYLAFVGVFCIHLFNLAFWRRSTLHGAVIYRAIYIILHLVIRNYFIFFFLCYADSSCQKNSNINPRKADRNFLSNYRCQNRTTMQHVVHVLTTFQTCTTYHIAIWTIIPNASPKGARN